MGKHTRVLLLRDAGRDSGPASVLDHLVCAQTHRSMCAWAHRLKSVPKLSRDQETDSAATDSECPLGARVQAIPYVDEDGEGQASSSAGRSRISREIGSKGVRGS